MARVSMHAEKWSGSLLVLEVLAAVNSNMRLFG